MPAADPRDIVEEQRRASNKAQGRLVRPLIPPSYAALAPALAISTRTLNAFNRRATQIAATKSKRRDPGRVQAELEHIGLSNQRFNEQLTNRRNDVRAQIIQGSVPLFFNELQVLRDSLTSTETAYKENGFYRVPTDKNKFGSELGRATRILRSQIMAEAVPDTITDLDFAQYVENLVTRINALAAADAAAAGQTAPLTVRTMSPERFARYINQADVPGAAAAAGAVPGAIETLGFGIDVRNWDFFNDPFKTELIRILKALKIIQENDTPDDERLKDLLIAHIGSTNADGSVSVQQAFLYFLGDAERNECLNARTPPNRRREILTTAGIPERITSLRQLNRLSGLHHMYAQNSLLTSGELVVDKIGGTVRPPAVDTVAAAPNIQPVVGNEDVMAYWDARDQIIPVVAAGVAIPAAPANSLLAYLREAIPKTEEAIRNNSNLQIDPKANETLRAIGKYLADVLFTEANKPRTDDERALLADKFLKRLVGNNDNVTVVIETPALYRQQLILATEEVTKTEHPTLTNVFNNLTQEQKTQLATHLSIGGAPALTANNISKNTIMTYLARKYIADGAAAAFNYIDDLQHGAKDELQDIFTKADANAPANSLRTEDVLQAGLKTAYYQTNNVTKTRPANANVLETEEYKNFNKKTVQGIETQQKSRPLLLAHIQTRLDAALRVQQILLQELQAQRAAAADTQEIARIDTKIVAVSERVKTITARKMELQIADNVYKEHGIILPTSGVMPAGWAFLYGFVNAFTGGSYKTQSMSAQTLPNGLKAITSRLEENEDGLILERTRYDTPEGGHFERISNILYPSVYVDLEKREEMSKKRLKAMLGKSGEGLFLGHDGYFYIPLEHGFANYYNAAFNSNAADSKLPRGLREFALFMDFVGFVVGGSLLLGIPFVVAAKNPQQSALFEMWASYNFSMREYATLHLKHRVLDGFMAKKLSQFTTAVPFDQAAETRFRSSLAQGAQEVYDKELELCEAKYNTALQKEIAKYMTNNNTITSKDDIPKHEMDAIEKRAIETVTGKFPPEVIEDLENQTRDRSKSTQSPGGAPTQRAAASANARPGQTS